jgi:uncharacterized protein YodC (DUF2158 family)
MDMLTLGDVVRLKTGSLPMIIVEYGTQYSPQAGWFSSDQWVEDTDSFICIWWEDQVRYQGLFSIYELEKS